MPCFHKQGSFGQNCLMVFSTDTFQGKDGFKLEYNAVKFQELHAGPSPWHPCFGGFSEGPPTIYEGPVLGLRKIGWKRLKEKFLDKKHSICLLADNDVDEKKVEEGMQTLLPKGNFCTVSALHLSVEKRQLLSGSTSQ